MSVRIFVEGGGVGPRSQRTQTACRKAFRLFFEKFLGERPKPRITASGSRDEAYQDFCRSLQHDHDTFAILLVDSEDPVPAGKSAREHLRARDHWTTVIPDGQVHLMVQCMEAWFLADKPVLESFYGDGFQISALPGNPNIEAVLKRDVLQGLHHASRAATKGPYDKTSHGFDILGKIDPDRVRKASRHAEDLITLLLAILTLPIPGS